MKKNTKSAHDFYNQEAQTYKKMYEPGYEYYPANLIRLKLIIKRLKENYTIPIKATFLGAHAFPMEYKELDSFSASRSCWKS